MNLKNFLKILFVLFALAFMAYYLNRNWGELQQYSWEFDLKLFLLSCVFLWVAFASATFMNKIIFGELAGADFTFWQMFKIYNLANVGRYLPGKLWNVLGLFYLTSERGIGKRHTTIAVVASEIGYKGSAIIIGLLYFIFSPSFKNLLPVMIVILFLSLILIHPRIIGYLLNLLFRLFKKQPIEMTFSYATLIKYILFCFIVWFLHSLAFYIFVNAISTTEPFNTIHFFTIMPLCWVVGYIMLFAPGGIGVREGMLVLILGEYLPSEIALVIAISQRIWFILIEAINVLIAISIPSNKQSLEHKISGDIDAS